MKTNISLFFGLILLLVLWAFISPGQTVITLRPGPADGIDSPLISIHPDSNFGDNPAFINCAWTFDGAFGIDRALLKFDLSQIPSTALILNARLSLYFWQGSATGHYGDNASYLQKVVEDWDEMTVTWDNQPDVTSTGSVLMPTSLSQSQDYPDIDITQFVSEWVATPGNNFGMLFRLVDETVFRSMLFASSENPDTSLRPKLVITYSACQAPVANFSYYMSGSTVHFSDSSSSASSWYWDFGDGYYSSLQNPDHTYAELGKYYTCLSITDSCGSDQVCDTIFVCEQPDPHFSYVVEGILVKFSDSSLLPTKWLWSFGDNFYSDLQNPVHYYQVPGTYYVCLTSENTCRSQTFCDSVIFQPNGTEARSSEKFTIFPVPAGDLLNIEWLYPPAGSGVIEIYDSHGKIVLCKEISLSSAVFHDELDIRALSAGCYFLKVTAGNVSLLRKFTIIKTL